MRIEVTVVGFDKKSELARQEFEVPATAWTEVRKIAAVPASDPDLLGSYPLSDQQASTIADLVHIAIDTRQYDYFLEVYEPGSPLNGGAERIIVRP